MSESEKVVPQDIKPVTQGAVLAPPSATLPLVQVNGLLTREQVEKVSAFAQEKGIKHFAEALGRYLASFGS